MADDSVSVRIDLDSGKAKKELKNFESDSVKFGEGFGKKFASGFAIGVAAIGASLVYIYKNATEAAIKQENAVNRLNQSLISSGRFSQQASEDMQRFASELQKVTIVGDETTIELLAFANTMADTNEQAKKMVKAALDLSAATGMSAESAVRNLGKSLGGLAGELGESVKEVRTLTAEQLKAGAAIDLLAKKYDGFAESQKRTFSGARQGVLNAMSDTLESIGKTSPMTISLLNQLEVAILKFNDRLAKAMGDSNFLKPFLDNLILFARAVNNLIFVPLELAFNLIRNGFNAIRLFMQNQLNVFAQIASKISSFFSPDSEISRNLALFAETTQETLSEFATKTKDSILNTFDFSATEKIDGFLGAVQESVNTASLAVEQSLSPISSGGGAVQRLTVGFEEIKKSFTDTANKIKFDAKTIADTLRTTLVSGVSNAFVAFGNALATGQNAMSAFGKSILSTLGGLAIQIGNFFVAVGIGMSAVSTFLGLKGGAAIAAGIGLITLGGVLQGIGSGPSSSGAQPTSGQSGVAPTSPVGPPDDISQVVSPSEQIKPSLTLNIQGNVLDRRQTGLEIAEVLRETFLTNDIRIA